MKPDYGTIASFMLAGFCAVCISAIFFFHDKRYRRCTPLYAASAALAIAAPESGQYDLVVFICACILVYFAIGQRKPGIQAKNPMWRPVDESKCIGDDALPCAPQAKPESGFRDEQSPDAR